MEIMGSVPDEAARRMRELLRHLPPGPVEIGSRTGTTLIRRGQGVAADFAFPTVTRLAGYDRSLDRRAEMTSANKVVIARSRDLTGLRDVTIGGNRVGQMEVQHASFCGRRRRVLFYPDNHDGRAVQYLSVQTLREELELEQQLREKKL